MGASLRANTSWILFRQALDACAASRRAANASEGAVFLAVSSCSDPDGCGRWVGSGAVSADAWRNGADMQATWASVMLNAGQVLQGVEPV